MEVPVQYFQTIVAIELAVAGALLFQIRFFEPQERETERDAQPSHAWLRLLVAVVIGATLVGSLDGMAHGGGSTVAIFVTIGLALSILPILIQVLPPLARDVRRDGRGGSSAVTIVGLLLYVVAVAALVFVLNR